MDDLRSKVRSKIYTNSGIIDTTVNGNAIVVFLGKTSAKELMPDFETFFKDTLRSQITDGKIRCVAFEDASKNLTDEVARVLNEMRPQFNHAAQNELYVSFVTLMDDDIYQNKLTIDINKIDELKTTALNGYAVEVRYDFYGIFTSRAEYEKRANARRTILEFLRKENGGATTRKRVYHQSSPVDDYYQSAKSITFLILANLIKKLDHNTVANNYAEGENYTWNTFALFEINLISLVIYEMISMLLSKQFDEPETVPIQNIEILIKNEMSALEAELKSVASAEDINYIPITVRKSQRNLTFFERIRGAFQNESAQAVTYRTENEESSINSLLAAQKSMLEKYVSDRITEEYKDSFIIGLIKKCTAMSSINNNVNNLILTALESCKNDLAASLTEQNGVATMNDYYKSRYRSLLASLQTETLDKIIAYYREHLGKYVARAQEIWNEMYQEVTNLINDFAAFKDYFSGISDLVKDKSINLMSDYDSVLENIDVQNVIMQIEKDNGIYSSVLNNYYDTVCQSGEIYKKFGDRNISPGEDNVFYSLFSFADVNVDKQLRQIIDKHWFRRHEVAILFTAKNKIEDCANLPFDI